MTKNNPLVSVVIPTRNRPELVLRAVRSALGQTYGNIEVIVVIDGPDQATVSALEAVQATDGRLRILPLPQSVGACDTRNAGINTANGEWIALLDDDDEWLPEKLDKQIALGERSSHNLPVISCKLIGRAPAADFIWPSTLPYLPIGDYLLARTGLFQGEGTLQTSTLIGRRELFQCCPFKSGLRKCQDWDWMIRAFGLPGVGLEFVNEPLAIWYIEESRATIGATNGWEFLLEWADSVRPRISPEAYASFLLTHISGSASDEGAWNALFRHVDGSAEVQAIYTQTIQGKTKE